jgi:hypothetical protein
MSRTFRHELNKRLACAMWQTCSHPIDKLADATDNIQISAFAIRANVVGFARDGAF